MDQYAVALKQYADDVLRGDFSVFPEVLAVIEKEYRERLRTEELADQKRRLARTEERASQKRRWWR